MFCQNCGSRSTDSSGFCAKCGNSQSSSGGYAHDDWSISSPGPSQYESGAWGNPPQSGAWGGGQTPRTMKKSSFALPLIIGLVILVIIVGVGLFFVVSNFFGGSGLAGTWELSYITDRFGSRVSVEEYFGHELSVTFERDGTWSDSDGAGGEYSTSGSSRMTLFDYRGNSLAVFEFSIRGNELTLTDEHVDESLTFIRRR